jgi:hypothetical protein
MASHGRVDSGKLSRLIFMIPFSCNSVSQPDIRSITPILSILSTRVMRVSPFLPPFVVCFLTGCIEEGFDQPDHEDSPGGGIPLTLNFSYGGVLDGFDDLPVFQDPEEVYLSGADTDEDTRKVYYLIQTLRLLDTSPYATREILEGACRNVLPMGNDKLRTMLAQQIENFYNLCRYQMSHLAVPKEYNGLVAKDLLTNYDEAGRQEVYVSIASAMYDACVKLSF